MTIVTLYHGTARSFTEFASDYTLRGSEPNSALGIHLTENPANAAEYARMALRDAHAGKARVVIVEVDVSKVAVVDSAADYLGRDPEIFDESTNRTRSELVERRIELEALGFHAVATAETELSEVDCCWAVLDASRIRIVGELSPDEAEELGIEDGFRFEGVDFVGMKLFEDEPEHLI